MDVKKNHIKLRTEMSLSHFLDLTLLDPDATREDIRNLQMLAEKHELLALCLLPIHLHLLETTSSVQRITVLNFPQGLDSSNQILKTMDEACNHRVDEIDYVFPWQDYLAGNKLKAIEQCLHVVRHAKEAKLIIKVIMETGAFPDSQMLFDASMAVLETDCDFLKTSTGRITTGASETGSKILLSAIQESDRFSEKNSCGIKFSGGIKTAEQAAFFIQLAESCREKQANRLWLRIGASTKGALNMIGVN